MEVADDRLALLAHIAEHRFIVGDVHRLDVLPVRRQDASQFLHKKYIASYATILFYTLVIYSYLDKAIVVW